jgi:hypothetical protein
VGRASRAQTDLTARHRERLDRAASELDVSGSGPYYAPLAEMDLDAAVLLPISAQNPANGRTAAIGWLA